MRTTDSLSRPGNQHSGSPGYQQAELYRLRGQYVKAEAAYREASQWGRQPQPGWALLRLAQGQLNVAVRATGHALDEARGGLVRCQLLPAYISIQLAAGEAPTARAAADELTVIAQQIDALLVHAAAATGRGAVLLAEGDARAGLADVRRAWRTWQELDVPYEAARVRELVGLACRQLGGLGT